MIVEFILSAFQSVVTILLYLLPNIPSMTQGIQDSLANIVSLINQTVGLIAYIYTPVIFIFVFLAIIAILSFDSIYRFVLWVLHKVRG